MSKIQGTLRKMRVELLNPVNYFMRLGEAEFKLNPYIGKKITMRFLGQINCIQCGRKTAKSFQQGYCFPCMRLLQECNLCLIHPERCLVETGQCPKDHWAHTQCQAEQVLYLANSSGLKVGITRKENIPMRWIDQGAIQGLPIFRAENRYRIGLLEVCFRKFRNDKTNWRAMLKNEVSLMDLTSERDQLLAEAQSEIKALQARYPDIQPLQEVPVEIHYPVITYPTKIVSLSFDTTPEVEGRLCGIKGQYLLLDKGVINMRKFGGYFIEVEV